MSDIAKVCNAYPNIEVNYEVEDEDEITVGSAIAVQVNLERDGDLTKVHAPFYPTLKDEGWWLMVGNAETNELFSIKRVSVGESAKARLELEAPETPGTHEVCSSSQFDLAFFLISFRAAGVSQRSLLAVWLTNVLKSVFVVRRYQYTLYFMCDSYIGCDQEYEFKVKVAEESDEEEEDEDEEEGEDEEDAAGRTKRKREEGDSADEEDKRRKQ